jgi:hypothetical protein
VAPEEEQQGPSGQNQVSPEEVTSGNGGSSTNTAGGAPATVASASSAGALPFTGISLPVVVLVGLALLGLGVGLRRISTAEG